MSIPKTYFQNLDGLRFIAFFSVFVAHIFDFSGFKVESESGTFLVERFFLHGDLGVNFFFVLSGFLITYLLLKEKQITSTISIPKFYMRRVLRIWPVYFLTILAGFYIIPQLFSNANPSLLPFNIQAPSERLPWYLCFAANFDIITNGPGFLIVSVLWSVSVEEQYYLIWPLINKFTSRKLLSLVIIAAILISFFYRLDIFRNSYKVKYASLSVLNDLAVGSLCGLLCFYSEKFRNFFAALKKRHIILVYIMLFVFIPLRGFIFSFPDEMVGILVAIEPLVFSALFAFIIVEQNYSNNSFFKISKIKTLGFLGRISYGLYSYHMICLFLTVYGFNAFFGDLLKHNLFLFLALGVSSLSFTVFISWLSFRFFEKRFLDFKHRFE